MKKTKINIVWIKRDIRSQDHLPFEMAEKSVHPYLSIFVFEPSLMAYPDTSLRHLQFQYQALMQLNQKLQPYNKAVNIFHSEAVPVLEIIQQQYEIVNLYSYQESGIALSYNRDKNVQKFCKENNINWSQFQRDGIVRGIHNRTGWDKKWYATMHSPIIKNDFTLQEPLILNNPYTLSDMMLEMLKNYPVSYQPAGEDFGIKYLQSFVNGRGQFYSKHISKPNESRLSCGRISPYLSWGNLSIKQVYQTIYNAGKIAKAAKEKSNFVNILSRLKWHCHFIQKFEVDCSYETKCINAGYELLEHPLNNEYIDAWKNANTGYPLVDACMKCLEATGWINFRMRAMLVSFFCHHLFQDWRAGTYHLAKLFLDYEILLNVRNPYSRMKSYYHSLFLKNDCMGSENCHLNFEQFLDKYCQTHGGLLHHFRFEQIFEKRPPKLVIRYENLGENTTLNTFNLQVQILESINLEKGNRDLEIGLSHWSGGMYVFQAINKDGKQTGKFHVN